MTKRHIEHRLKRRLRRRTLEARAGGSSRRTAARLLEPIERLAAGAATLAFLDGVADALSAFVDPGLQDSFVDSIVDEVHGITG